MPDWKHLRDTTPVARREYQCLLCELPIRAGTHHVLRVGTQYGNIHSMRMHIHCERKARVWDQLDWETATFGEEFRRFELGESYV